MKRILLLAITAALLLSGCNVWNIVPDETNPTVPESTEVLQTQQIDSMENTYETIPTETTTPTEPCITNPTELVFDSLAMAAAMTVEEKVGQLFLARCPEENAEEDVANYHLGGYVLFGRDFQNGTPEHVAETIARYQGASSVPLLIAVDEEGGTVTRVSSYTQFRETRFPSPQKLYAEGGLTRVEEAETEKCNLLKTLGINVNLAPVCDVTTDPQAFMYRRSLGVDAVQTGEYVRTMVELYATHQVGSVLKHFPGYGNNADTHVGIAVDARSLSELEGRDLLPFAAGIDAGCKAIMVSHTIVNCLDTEYPASLSPAAHGYLREQMHFDGVIVTDDLVMEAITDLYGTEEAAILAVLAGNDLLCSSEYQVQYPAVLEAVRTGRISEEQLDKSVARVLDWKHALGLL